MRVVLVSRKYSRRAHRDPQKICFPFKQINGRNGDYKWLGMTDASYYVIYYEKFRTIMQRTEKEALTWECLTTSRNTMWGRLINSEDNPWHIYLCRRTMPTLIRTMHVHSCHITSHRWYKGISCVSFCVSIRTDIFYLVTVLVYCTNAYIRVYTNDPYTNVDLFPMWYMVTRDQRVSACQLVYSVSNNEFEFNSQWLPLSLVHNH